MTTRRSLGIPVSLPFALCKELLLRGITAKRHLMISGVFMKIDKHFARNLDLLLSPSSIRRVLNEEKFLPVIVAHPYN
jgi:hypothetical protein